MKTNNAIITQIESGQNPFDVIKNERTETTKGLREEYRDSTWKGAIEANYIFALQEIIKLRKENARLERENFERFKAEHADNNNYDDFKNENV